MLIPRMPWFKEQFCYDFKYRHRCKTNVFPMKTTTKAAIKTTIAIAYNSTSSSTSTFLRVFLLLQTLLQRMGCSSYIHLRDCYTDDAAEPKRSPAMNGSYSPRDGFGLVATCQMSGPSIIGRSSGVSGRGAEVKQLGSRRWKVRS